MFSSIKNSLKERKENVQKTYPLGYIHIGTCQQTFQKGKNLYTYTHYDCFLSDQPGLEHSTKLQRLTGNYSANSFTEKDMKKRTYGALSIHSNDSKKVDIKLIDSHNKDKQLTYTITSRSLRETHFIPVLEDFDPTKKVSLNKIQKFIEAKNNASMEEAEITPKKSKYQDHIDSLFDSFSNPK